MILLPDKHLVVVDLETTDENDARAAGVCPEIIEVGAVLLNAEMTVLDEFQSLVKPRRMDGFTRFCHRLTGIEKVELEAAEPWERVWKGFAEFTRYKGHRMAAWSAWGDVPTLQQEYTRRRLGFPHNPAVICLMSVVYAQAMTQGLGISSWGLRPLCRRFDIEVPKYHRALPDARLAVEAVRSVVSDSSDDRGFEVRAV